MPLREFVLNNFRWKLTALLLAILVWSVIKFAMYKQFTEGRNQVLRHQPVMVLKSADDNRVFRIDPPTVDVVVQATKELSPEDVEVFLDLTTMPDVNSALKQVIVRAEDVTKIVRTDPGFVLVERVPTLDTSLTNALPKP